MQPPTTGLRHLLVAGGAGFIGSAFVRRQLREDPQVRLTVPFRQGMEATVAWYRDHEAWWRRRKSAEFWQFYRQNYRGLPTNAIP